MTLHNVTSSVPEIGVAMIGSGLMAKSHTMGYRNVEAVYGTTPFRPRFTVLADAARRPGPHRGGVAGLRAVDDRLAGSGHRS